MSIVPHSLPSLDEEELNYVTEAIRAGQLAVGPGIAEFEGKVAKYINRKYSIGTSNGTAAIHLALLALAIQDGDEVILPASVCPGVMHAVEYTGATPILCDVNPDDLNLSFQSTLAHISDKTKAIILPHMYGIPSDIDLFLNLNIPVIEDCAQAFGATYKGKSVGSYGQCAIFSFYATKMLTSIDGGMVLTNDKNIELFIRDRLYYAGKREYKLRFNYKLQNINAVVGLAQLNKIEAFLEERREIFNRIYERLRFKCGFKVLQPEGYEYTSSNYKLLISFDDECCKKRFVTVCEKHGISINKSIFVDLYDFKYGKGDGNMVNLKKHLNDTFSFPIYPGINMDKIDCFLSEFM